LIGSAFTLWQGFGGKMGAVLVGYEWLVGTCGADQWRGKVQVQKPEHPNGEGAQISLRAFFLWACQA
jgi:hypothetical protein